MHDKLTAFAMSQAPAACAIVCYFLLCAAALEEEALSHCCEAALEPSLVAASGSASMQMAFIIGAMKAGTTFLYDELVTRHPAILARTVPEHMQHVLSGAGAKENHYFATLPLPSSLETYLHAYALSRDKVSSSLNLSPESLTFIDATPGYMIAPPAACRIRWAFPKAKIIAILRDPVQRALSHWNMDNWAKENKTAFGPRVQAEVANLRATNCSFEEAQPPPASPSGGATQAASPGLPRWEDCFRCVFECGSYEGPAKPRYEPADLRRHCRARGSVRGLVNRGLYADQLQMWLRLFPAEQMLILNHEEMLKTPEPVLERVVRFLGQDPGMLKPSPTARPHHDNVVPAGTNINQVLRNKTASGFFLPRHGVDKIPHEAIQELYKYFEGPNERLYQLMASLGPSIGWRGSFAAKGHSAAHKAGP